ncbi:hypothetical protein H0H81_008161 [Sphagnurus paluster]|uniref:MFS general substrate transporter n=1 Tax=Sphagnurus paluster TaxID=117069 RepID=A0A9P7GK66_9AGAR|nr:hypothetical protein H0H81_008161 [Sphagnurus paluster]
MDMPVSKSKFLTDTFKILIGPCSFVQNPDSQAPFSQPEKTEKLSVMSEKASHTFMDVEKHPIDTSSSASTSSQNDPALKKTWRKIDMYILPVAAMFYLLSFLVTIDRTNLGNARIAGLQKELKMTNHQYSIALTVTYVPYIAAELPSNLLLKAACSPGSFSTSRPGILARSFNGVSGFFSAASISGAFSGLLAYGIIRMDGVGHRPGWAWIFILEGLFTFVFGLCSFTLLPRSPAHARFLNKKEKEYVAAQLKESGATSGDDGDDKFSWREVGQAFTLPQVWMLAIIAFCGGALLFGLAYFTPSIVQGLGYTAARAQLFSVPPFAVAFFVSMICAFFSDRYACRGLVTIFCAVLCLIGFSMFLASHDIHIKYASLFFSISGAYAAAPSLSSWSANNTAPHTRRATAIAITFIMTNSGGILVTWLLGVLSPAPLYRKATITLLAFSALIIVTSVLNIWYLAVQNRKKAEVRATITRADEEPGLGDRSAWFVYSL